MLIGKRIFTILILLSGFLLFRGELHSQPSVEHGLLPVFNFSSKTYNAQEQNLAITKDKRGLMYFANRAGILEYDGVNWRLILLDDEKMPRSLATDDQGKVFVGSENDIGYLSPDSSGNLKYVSLHNFIPAQYKDHQDVWNVYAKKGQVYFQTENSIYIWNGAEIRVVPSEFPIHEFFMAGDNFFARLKEKGLAKFNGNTFELIPGGKFFEKKPVFGIVQVDSLKLLLATEKDGLFLIDANSSKNISAPVKPFSTQADKYLEKYGIYNLELLGNNLISVGTWGGGLVIINLDGKIHSIIDKECGLQDQIILDQKPDENGSLWVALSKGISRIEILSPVSLFNNQKGLQGTVESIASYRGRIYAATYIGLFFSDLRKRDLNGSQYSDPVFKPIDNLQIECWDLLDFKYKGYEALLVVTNTDISLIDQNHKITRILEGVIFKIYQSKLDPARVYVGRDNGLSTLYFSKGKWIDEGMIKGIDETISDITEDYLGNLWLGTPNQGVIRMNIQSIFNDKIYETEILKFDTLNGLPKGQTLVSNITGRLVIGTSKGLFKYNPYQKYFDPDSSFGIQFVDKSHYIHRIRTENENRAWLVTVTERSKDKYILGYLEYASGKGYQWITRPFMGLSESIQHAIYPDENGIVWFGGPEGLYRYDPGIRKNYNADFFTLVRKVTLSDGTLIFGGTNIDQDGNISPGQPANIQPTLPFSSNSINFEFSAQSSENEASMRFSYLLEGYDKKWSAWSAQSKKEYTNLNEGHYKLRVRSRNIYGHEGDESTFSFTILSPWYRTVLAYIAYVVLLSFLVYSIVMLYTRSLRRIIQERTAEVVRQKTEIELKNKEITDSIHYASRIQSAILPPEEYLKDILNDYFILYMPRDIVSGDFYWIYSENNRLITVTADCTGHGVPGAFMSMLGVAFLNEIVIRHEDSTADQILDELRAYVIKSLRQTGREGENQDGMDISLCIYDLNSMKAQFSGANNDLLLIRNNEVIIYPADNMPIGIHTRHTEAFSLHEFDIRKGDVFYTFTDGYVDQFGGPMGKKYMTKKFKNLLLSIHKDDMKKQKKKLKDEITGWMQNLSQVDDILVMGIKI